MTKKATADPTPDPKPEPKPTTEPTLLKLIKEVTELTEPTDEQVVEPEDVAAALSLSMNLLDDDDATLDDPYSMSMGPDYLDDDPAPAATGKSSKSKARKSKSDKETGCVAQGGACTWTGLGDCCIPDACGPGPYCPNAFDTFCWGYNNLCSCSCVSKKQPFMLNGILVSESLSPIEKT